MIIILQDGFTAESTAVIHLWKILNEFNEDEKKMFLKFVTGRLVRKFIYNRASLYYYIMKPNINFSSCDCGNKFCWISSCQWFFYHILLYYILLHIYVTFFDIPLSYYFFYVLRSFSVTMSDSSLFIHWILNLISITFSPITMQLFYSSHLTSPTLFSPLTIHSSYLLLLHSHHLQHSDRSPIDGLSKLAFVVSKNGTEDQRLPSAHTCFNHLLLPAYSTLEIMRCKIRYAMTQSEGFGLRWKLIIIS